MLRLVLRRPRHPTSPGLPELSRRRRLTPRHQLARLRVPGIVRTLIRRTVFDRTGLGAAFRIVFRAARSPDRFTHGPSFPSPVSWFDRAGNAGRTSVTKPRHAMLRRSAGRSPPRHAIRCPLSRVRSRSARLTMEACGPYPGLCAADPCGFGPRGPHRLSNRSVPESGSAACVIRPHIRTRSPFPHDEQHRDRPNPAGRHQRHRFGGGIPRRHRRDHQVLQRWRHRRRNHREG